MADYLIWSNEHRAWWMPGRCGYTTLTHEAGRYSEAAADAILRQANYNPAPPPNEVKCLAPPDRLLIEQAAAWLGSVRRSR